MMVSELDLERGEAMVGKNWQVPRVVFQPDVYLGMQRGINQLVNAIRPTLGPYPRLVAMESILHPEKMPDLLDSGGLIARRIIQLSNRDEDAGAMLLRHMLWQLHEKAGDGTATAAVIFQSIYNQSVRVIAAGGDAMQLRAHLERGSQLIIDQLEGMKVFIRGREKLARLSETLCYDPELAGMLGEIFAVIGEFGQLDIRAGQGRDLEREYYQGMYWEGGLLSRWMATDLRRGSACTQDAAILISDLEIDDPEDLIPLLELAVRSGIRSLLIIANKMAERALSLLLSQQARVKLQILAVKTPGRTADDQWAALQDLSILTGARPLLKAAGDTIRSIKPELFGRTSQVYADLDQFGIIAPHCDQAQLQQHLGYLKDAFSRAENAQVRRRLLERIGKLQGGSAVLRIGAATLPAIEARKASAERASEAIRSAMRSGVVPGGGAAYLDCCPALQARLKQAKGLEETAACRILIRALHEPMRTLLSNAGVSAGAIIGQVEQNGPGTGFDLTRNRVVPMLEEGVYDSAAVAKAVVSCSIRGAAVALTTDVLVHRRNPPDASCAT